MRAVLGILACLLVVPAWADGAWRVVAETLHETVSIDFDSLQRNAGRVSFRERRVMLGVQTDPNSLRSMREVLSRRVIDCRARRIATLSRAVFSDDDAMIDHQATRLNQAVWQPIPAEDRVFKQMCGRS
jgi:Txe/YoeB family toxin of Txe-Axe toxin-antitoxin module